MTLQEAYNKTFFSESTPIPQIGKKPIEPNHYRSKPVLRICPKKVDK